MSYKAIVCELKNVRSHPNADRLKLSTILGYQVIVGLEAKEGDLGVFFGSDGMLTKEHCMANKLYNKHPETGEPMGGYFGSSGRVKVTKLRGEISDGFWQPVEAFAWTGDISCLKLGVEFDTINGHKICQKYYTPATIKALNKQRNVKKGKGNKKKKIDRSMLHEHYSTGQIRHNINRIPRGAVLYITEKMQGTSGRTGRIRSVSTLSWFKQKWNQWFSCKFIDHKWEYVSGSRRVVLDPKTQKDGYYKSQFRDKINDEISSIGLHKGEVLYYEIVGYTETGAAIMGSHGLKDKELVKKYGKTMTYSYGCEPKEYDVYVYRIAMINEDGVEIDLPWAQVTTRCKQLGLKTVPLLTDPVIFKDKQECLDLLTVLSDGPSTIDDRHIREGVVVKVESTDMNICLKFKGWTFCELEGIQKNSSTYVDMEEIS